jgi:polyisoprenoid-binding protein YceI
MTQTDAPVATITGDYDLDPTHTRIGFAAKHAMVTTVRGSFLTFTGEAHLDLDDISKSTATLEIDAASVETGQKGRDDHLRTSDFLEIETYPKISFVSTSAERKDEDNFVLHGDLTIKNVTKPVSIDFEKTGEGEDPWGGFRVGFEGKAKINRTDWGVDFNMPLGAGGLVISEKVTLEFDIAAVKRAS